VNDLHLAVSASALIGVLSAACEPATPVVGPGVPSHGVTSAVAAPSNDAFASPTTIATLPFSDARDIFAASLEPGEPMPSCSFGGADRTIWYAFTPTTTTWIGASVTNASFDAVIAVYTGNSLADVSESGCRRASEGRLVFQAQAGTIYYLQVGGMFGGGGPLEFHVDEIPPPPNNDLANATVIGALPFADAVDVAAASREADEPVAPCASGADRTVWYTFTPTEMGSISAFTINAGTPVVVAAYRGTLPDLEVLGCSVFGGKVTFRAEAGTPYFFQMESPFIPNFPLGFRLEVTPPPTADLAYGPYLEPSTFDVVNFFNFSSDPGEVGFASADWTFGDGGTGSGFVVDHQYARDGDYAVGITVTTLDGRVGSTIRTVPVRTHDVAVTRFSVPQAASAGQTRRIVVGVNSKRYPETVATLLFRSVPGGFELVASLTQAVPVRPASRTTDFAFNYTFTADDARLGKVTFKTVAFVTSARDALPADNEVVALPTSVHK